MVSVMSETPGAGVVLPETAADAMQPRFRSDVTVELVKHVASDADVLFAARVSTKGESSLDDVNADPSRSQGLLNYLMRDRHGTPFEHNSMTFFVSAPIFVFREFMRHRIGFSYNEESGRYRQLEPVFYVPGPDRLLVQEGKPGRYVFIAGHRRAACDRGAGDQGCVPSRPTRPTLRCSRPVSRVR